MPYELDISSDGDAQRALGVCGEVLTSGGVAVLPTDTVYGIGLLVSAHPDGADALFRIKQRPAAKKIPLLIPSIDALFEYGVNINNETRALALAFWPGGLTLIVVASKKVPPAYQNLDGTVALRVPGKSFALDLLEYMGEAMAVTSANISGMPASADSANLDESLTRQADVVVRAGTTPCGESSTIVDCTGEQVRIVRQGAVTRCDIAAVCGTLWEEGAAGQ